MKNLLKIMTIFTFTSVTLTNISACDFSQNSPIDYNQLLQDAANMIANNSDSNFTNFFKDKDKNHISDFIPSIKQNISNLFRIAKEDFSNLTYEITNGNDEVKAITTIKIHLAVASNPTVKDCSFNANFSPLQEYIDKLLKPLIDGTQYLSISKTDTGGFYHDLLTAGADFQGEKEHYLTNVSKEANIFWKEFQAWKPSKEITNPLLGNVLEPLLTFIEKNNKNTGLTFDNFKPYLLNIDNHSDVIAITGNKEFAGQKYDYIKIGLAGQNSDTAALGEKYEGLTFIFTTNS